MAYKDKDKQREANRKASQRYRDQKLPIMEHIKDMKAKGMTNQGMTVIDERSNEPSDVIPKYPRVTDQEFTRRLATLPPGSPNVRVSKPGDADYEPQCETTKAFVEDRPKAEPESKRGLDIKCFEDLPLDVQETIRTISESNEEFQRRTGIAIRYQHLFPERYHSTGAAQ